MVNMSLFLDSGSNKNPTKNTIQLCYSVQLKQIYYYLYHWFPNRHRLESLDLTSLYNTFEKKLIKMLLTDIRGQKVNVSMHTT